MRAALSRKQLILKQQRWVAFGAGKLALYVTLGPSLVASIRCLFEALRLRPGTFPQEEIAQVTAAIIRRMLMVGLLGISVAMVPTLLLGYQNLLLTRQNSLITDQNSKIDAQSHLIEAQRRAGLMFEFTSILDSIEDTRKEWIDERPDIAETAKEMLNQELSKEEKGEIVSSAVSHLSGFDARTLPTEGSTEFQKWANAQIDERRKRLTALVENKGLTTEVETLVSGGSRPKIEVDGIIVPDKLVVAPSIRGRIVALLIALRPYRFFDVAGEYRADTDRSTSRLSIEQPTLVQSALRNYPGCLMAETS